MIRIPALVASLALTAMTVFAAPAQAVDLSAMTDAERAAFRTEVRAYLLDNPEIIMEAVALLEQRQVQAESEADKEMISANAQELFNDGYSWVGGNPDGDITLVEFMDYRCGYCRRAAPEVEALLHADGNIRLIVKEFPILGEGSLISARFAVATKQVAGMDAYKQVHDALISYKGDVSDIALRRISDGLGLDTDAIMAQMPSDEVSDELDRNRALGQRLKISGTPSFVLEDEMLRGYLPADQMAMIVKSKRRAN